MKSYWVICLLYLGTSLSLCGVAKHRATPLVKNPAARVATTPEEIEALDSKTDIAIFNHFITILASFTKILLNPQDPVNATQGASKMVDGIVSIAQELTKRSNTNPTQKQLDNMVRLIILALVRQGLLPPAQVGGYSIS